MSRAGEVFYRGELAGRIERREDGRYVFAYRPEYLARPDARAVSLKDLQCRLLRIDPEDDFARLLKTAGHDVIGAVTVEEAS